MCGFCLARGIMELLEVMRLDMANFTITQMRPHIQQQSVEYERKKFREFLESQSSEQFVWTCKQAHQLTVVTLISLPEFACGVDGLEYTRKWLKRNYHSIDVSGEPNDAAVINKVLAAAFSELLVWSNDKQDMFPETLLMDENRFE